MTVKSLNRTGDEESPSNIRGQESAHDRVDLLSLPRKVSVECSDNKVFFNIL